MLAVAVLSGAAAAVALNVPAAQDPVFKRVATAVMARAPEPLDGMRVIVCGNASPLGTDPERAEACIAVVTPEHFFLFDVGARSPLRMAQAKLPMARINGVFLTHFHSDHIAALPDVNLVPWGGAIFRKRGFSIVDPLEVAAAPTPPFVRSAGRASAGFH